MEIKLYEIAIKDIAKDFIDDEENGVVGYGGLLDIRPKYQREFVYNDTQQKAVIDTILKGFPLNIMYWIKNGSGTFEVLDGQQRTISFCKYVHNKFSVDDKIFANRFEVEKNQILNYKCMIYICEGNDLEKLQWFNTINIVGVKLTKQEIRNAVYAGSWTIAAKKLFSKNNCAAYNLGGRYLNGTAIRQDYLETAIKWINNGKIENYMSIHQHDENATALWQYFEKVINWVMTIYPKYYKEMKGLDWGLLYNKYKDKEFNVDTLEEEVSCLMRDREVTNKKGIFEYLLSKDLSLLNLRQFDDTDKRELYEICGGICSHCVNEHRTKTHYDIEEMEADHITPWIEGGKTEISNGQMLCREHNRKKSSK